MGKFFVGVAGAEPAGGLSLLHADVDEAGAEVDGEARLVCVAGVGAADFDGEEVAKLFDGSLDAVLARQEVEIPAAQERKQWSPDFGELEEFSGDSARTVGGVFARPALKMG